MLPGAQQAAAAAAARGGILPRAPRSASWRLIEAARLSRKPSSRGRRSRRRVSVSRARRRNENDASLASQCSSRERGSGQELNIGATRQDQSNRMAPSSTCARVERDIMCQLRPKRAKLDARERETYNTPRGGPLFSLALVRATCLCAIGSARSTLNNFAMCAPRLHIHSQRAQGLPTQTYTDRDLQDSGEPGAAFLAHQASAE